VFRPPAQSGTTLVETLVATLLFSVGVLATVSLQAHTVRHIEDAHHRATAAQLASSLVAAMWTDSPESLAARYGGAGNGDGYRDFVQLAHALPGTTLPGNTPEVRIEQGPSASSHAVSVTLRWQAPGETTAHRYSTSSVVSHN